MSNSYRNGTTRCLWRHQIKAANALCTEAPLSTHFSLARTEAWQPWRSISSTRPLPQNATRRLFLSSYFLFFLDVIPHNTRNKSDFFFWLTILKVYKKCISTLISQNITFYVCLFAFARFLEKVRQKCVLLPKARQKISSADCHIPCNSRNLRRSWTWIKKE